MPIRNTDDFKVHRLAFGVLFAFQIGFDSVLTTLFSFPVNRLLAKHSFKIKTPEAGIRTERTKLVPDGLKNVFAKSLKIENFLLIRAVHNTQAIRCFRAG